MDDRDRTEPQDLPAGRFSTWLVRIAGPEQQRDGASVPCGQCTACCTSSQFVHIGPDETDTLSRVPDPLLFPAPGLPSGHVLMGYDERGHCPMFVDGRCSIYDHRPLTCRTYDCRVFPAAGIQPDDDKPAIAERTQRWSFTFPTARDETLLSAVQAASTFLRDHGGSLSTGLVPRNPTQLAFLAVKIHAAFLVPGAPPASPPLRAPSVEVVEAAIRRAGAR